VRRVQASFGNPRPQRAALAAAGTRLAALAPGVALSGAVAIAAYGLCRVEDFVFGRAWLESLAMTLLVGVAVRTAWAPASRWCAGIAFSAKTVLEVAVVLLGASVSTATIASLGWALPAAVLALVATAVTAGALLGLAFGLPWRMALLVACGNSICGNSAIAAVAPVIGAKAEDVTCAIAFTAVLGIATVIGLPILGRELGMSGVQFGVLAGLTVYAVPQVLAATAPMGAAAVHTGTLVKLVRVMMLGPVCMVLGLITRRGDSARKASEGAAPAATSTPAAFVPWFILGFLGLAALRSIGGIPEPVLRPTALTGEILTAIAMAALGLSTDIRTIVKAGPSVAMVVTLSLLGIGALSFGIIALLHPA
jgi:uncharacterized integral membrane protein (TIGR00698 family)